ncbi:MAG: efflux transporter outer membrane subunit [Geobacteraceae bacterium]|nr:efflux transporter outer membrane subunit [Geobacteraceae bacterium]
MKIYFPLFIRKLRLRAVFIMLTLSACAPACAPYTAPEREMAPPDLPEQFSTSKGTEAPPTAWWEEFGSVTLNQRVERALRHNTSIREAWARLRQNRAFERIEDAALLPQLDYSADASHTRKRQQDRPLSTAEQFGLALKVTRYELDVWGRVRANVRAGELATLSSAADLQAVRVSIAATVVDNWMELQTRRAILPLAQQQWDAAKDQVELLRQRYLKGMANSEDLLEQEQEVTSLRTRMEHIREQISRLEFELAVLSGDMPQKDDVAPITYPYPAQDTLPGLNPLSPVRGLGIPLQMLRQRPDIQAARLRLQEADWSVAAAQANRLPALRLSAEGRLSAPHLNEVLDNWLANLAASVTGPVFDGGRRRAEVERARAVVDERLATYRDTILSAVQEVEMALEQERRARARLVEAQRTHELREQIYISQRLRYLNGNDTFLNLLNARQSLDSGREDVLQTRLELYQARVALHRALGGRVTAPEHIDSIGTQSGVSDRI